METNVTENIYFILVAGTMGMFILALTVISAIIYYQNRRIKHQNDLRQLEVEHRLRLLQNSIDVQEKERKRFSEDLHDDTGAVLAAARLNLYSVMKNSDHPALLETKELIDIAISGIRRIAHDLSPPALARFGLYHALGDFCRQISVAEEISVETEIADLERLDLDTKTEMAVYRVYTELINNTLKHSACKHICVRVHYKDNRIEGFYSDDGKGFEIPENGTGRGLGFKNMESRISALLGEISFSSGPGKGMQAQMYIPYTPTI